MPAAPVTFMERHRLWSLLVLLVVLVVVGLVLGRLLGVVGTRAITLMLDTVE